MGVLVGCGSDALTRADGVSLADCDAVVVGYFDADGDGFGRSDRTSLLCGALPAGYASKDGDCDDFRDDVSPDAQEVCDDGLDQDCDGLDDVCEDLPLVWTLPGADDWGLGEALAAADDLTGDGVADLVVTGTKAGGGAGIVRVLGGPVHPVHGPASVATYTGPLGGMFGTDVVALGDVQGDGVSDFAWGAPGDGMLGDGAGRVWLGWGPAVGNHSSGMGSGLVAGDNGVWGVGASLASGADLTGDGVADLVVGAPEGGDWLTYEGRAFVVPLPLPTDHVASVGTDALAFYGTASADLFGSDVAVVPDRDGDGLAELAVSAPSADGSRGAVYLWSGPVTAGGAAADADERIDGLAPGERFGEAVAGMDTDGDGLAELVVGAPSVAGGRVDLVAPDGVRVQLSATGIAGIGTAFDGADLDGDGWLDLVVGAPVDADQRGAVAVWWGPLSASADWADLDDRFEGEDPAGQLGSSVAVHPDWTGDGLPEVVVGVPGAGGSAGALFVVSGELWGLAR